VAFSLCRFADDSADSMPARRLEDQIRELCARSLHEEEPELADTLRELQSAIQKHMLRVKNLTTAATVAHQPHLIRERRGR
jgi:hypothetical protein